MTELQIDREGIIQGGEYKGWTVRIEEDNGSYLILIYNHTDPEHPIGYDDWVEDYDALKRYWAQVKWYVVWK